MILIIFVEMLSKARILLDGRFRIPDGISRLGKRGLLE